MFNTLSETNVSKWRNDVLPPHAEHKNLTRCILIYAIPFVLPVLLVSPDLIPDGAALISISPPRQTSHELFWEGSCWVVMSRSVAIGGRKKYWFSGGQ